MPELKWKFFSLGILLGVFVLLITTSPVSAFITIPRIAPVTPIHIPPFKRFHIPKIKFIKRPKITPTPTPTPTQTPTPTPTPTITSTPSPTPTSSPILNPSNTPTPTPTLTPTNTPTPTPTPLFAEEFSSISLNTWEFHPNGGIFQIGNGEVSLSGKSLSNFPFFLIKFNPFPPIGDFSIEIKINYSQQNSYGTGVVATEVRQDPLTFGSPYISPSLLGVWSDGVVFNLQNITPVTGTGYHTYRFSFHEPNTWQIYVDDILKGVKTNSVRPASIWFGSPDPTPHDNWSPFTIDYIRIYGYDK